VKKPFKDTKIGKFLKEKAPKLFAEALTTVGDLTGVKALTVVGNLIKGSKDISEEDKAIAAALLEFEKQELTEVTNRWKYDMVSDSWLSKNVRPLTLVFLLVLMATVMIIDSVESWRFDVKESYIGLLEVLLITVVAAFFGSRWFNKYQKIKKQ